MNNETALQKINEADRSGSLVFVDRQNGFPSTELYSAEITSISIDKENQCHSISGKFMPKKEVVDRIGEATGIIFTRGETKTSTIDDANCGRRTVYVGIAQGKVRMPDGSWRESSICDYEFDPTLRAMLDFDVTEINETTKKKQRVDRQGRAYGSTLARAILEYQKVACQRANTGARLRVIRELVGMPIALSAQEIARPLVFSRIVQNTSYILQTPEGRAMATAQALGVDMATLFGKKKELPQNNVEADKQNATLLTQAETEVYGSEAVEPVNQTQTAPPQSETIPDFEAPSTSATPPQQSEFDCLTNSIRDFLEGYSNELNITVPSGANPYKSAEIELQNPTATVETRRDMINRLRTFLQKKGYNV
jgi:hypothetical protein